VDISYVERPNFENTHFVTAFFAILCILLTAMFICCKYKCITSDTNVQFVKLITLDIHSLITNYLPSVRSNICINEQHVYFMQRKKYFTMSYS
jgi:hypothetical protein